MHHSITLMAAFAVTNVFAHGVIDSVKGANGVDMPGLSVIDGTRRDCGSPTCGSEADTAIIRQREIGTNKASALGRTVGAGPIDASKMVNMFMGDPGNATTTKAARELHAANVLRRSLGERAANGGIKTPKGTMETGVKAAAGMGASSGMPTCTDDGKINMNFHQVNQDGAGPLSAKVDATSGGTDPSAFKNAEVTKNVPGIGIGGLSTAAVMDFPVEVQMPQGMMCSGTVGSANNVCIVRVQNQAAAGPFGGAAAFTQSPTAKKRAIEYNLSRRRFARNLVKKTQEEEATAAIAALKAIGSANSPEDEDLPVKMNKRGMAEGTQRDQDVAAAIAALDAIGSDHTADANLGSEQKQKRDMIKSTQKRSPNMSEDEDDEDEDEDDDDEEEEK